MDIYDVRCSLSSGVGAKDLQESFRAVAKNVRPAVVNVSSVRIIQNHGPGPELDPFFENHPFREFFGDDFFKRFLWRPGRWRWNASAGAWFRLHL